MPGGGRDFLPLISGVIVIQEDETEAPDWIGQLQGPAAIAIDPLALRVVGVGRGGWVGGIGLAAHRPSPSPRWGVLAEGVKEVTQPSLGGEKVFLEAEASGIAGVVGRGEVA
jgi:hypothetical protein